MCERGSVGIFGVEKDEGEDGDEQSQLAVCVYTDANVVHRVTLQRPVCRPGERVSSFAYIILYKICIWLGRDKRYPCQYEVIRPVFFFTTPLELSLIFRY